MQHSAWIEEPFQLMNKKFGRDYSSTVFQSRIRNYFSSLKIYEFTQNDYGPADALENIYWFVCKLLM